MNSNNKLYLTLIICTLILALAIIIASLVDRYAFIPEINALLDKLTGKLTANK